MAAVVAGLLAIGGGVYLATAGDDGPKRPVAAPNSSATPSGSPSVDQGDGKGTGVGRSDYDPNADIEAGEARVWLRENETALTKGGAWQYGPWRVGDVMVRAMYKEVTGYAVADGKEQWKVTLDTPLCGVPRIPSAQGKLVVGVLESNTKGAHCKYLQQIDLATGRAGWKVARAEDRPGNSTLTVNMAISGDTVALAWPGGASGYSVADGHKLYDLQRTGGCSPQGFAGGTRLISAGFCFYTDPKDQPGDLLQELDPATGRAKWSYQYDKGWRIGQILSVDPLVVTALPKEGTDPAKEGKAWKILAFTADGRLRSQTEPKFLAYGACSGYGQSVDEFQNCYGAAADAQTLYIAADGKEADMTGDEFGVQVVAVDLNTGREKWRADPPKGRRMRPLAFEDGKVVLYVDPAPQQGAAVATLAPTGGAPQEFLRSPSAASGAERTFFSARIAWAGGRLFVLNNRVESPTANATVHAALSFGK
ncbi:PQQ-binding-like beta-propeller repeat protein [Streptomyces sp. NPDC094438]|uniref:outer membrane protein assembly factor BamB family protein n=1 Tax=Streptomyces sp. NPDC094438 TaxID=3366061 RepID=UPI0037FAA094